MVEPRAAAAHAPVDDVPKRARVALLVTIGVTLALYYVPYARFLGYPLMLLSTLAHETGHGIAALLVGGNFDALRQINYNGWLMVEAFGLALPELAAATKIWRRMFTSEEQLSRDALAFMKAQVAKRW